MRVCKVLLIEREPTDPLDQKEIEDAINLALKEGWEVKLQIVSVFRHHHAFLLEKSEGGYC